MNLFSRSPWDPPTLLERIFTTPIQFLLTSLYRFFSRLHSSPRLHPSPSSSKIRVVCISDTHSQTYTVPDGDVLIHAGDMTRRGTVQELQAHIDWLGNLPHKYKLAIAGNHDTYLDPSSRKTLEDKDRRGELDWKSVRYLQHSGTTLEFDTPANEQGTKKRTIKVYGAPQIPKCGGVDNAFQYERSQDAWTDTVPAGIDILITHTPPKYHLDLQHPSMGCEHLLREVKRVKPKLHVFGHVHSGAGRETVWWDDVQTVYEAGMARTSDGFFGQLLDFGLWVDLVQAAIAGVSSVVWDRIWGGEHACTVMVNAALMYRNTGVLRNRVQVVDM
jgi:Icc-related predicted phosphoesterase